MSVIDILLHIPCKALNEGNAFEHFGELDTVGVPQGRSETQFT